MQLNLDLDGIEFCFRITKYEKSNSENLYKLYDQWCIVELQQVMTIAMNFDVDMSGLKGAMVSTGGTSVVNNFNNDNSRTVNQTNNSPKSLSRLEIYRQTRNALNV